MQEQQGFCFDTEAAQKLLAGQNYSLICELNSDGSVTFKETNSAFLSIYSIRFKLIFLKYLPDLIFLAILGVISSVISAYYYLNIIRLIYRQFHILLLLLL